MAMKPSGSASGEGWVSTTLKLRQEPVAESGFGAAGTGLLSYGGGFDARLEA
jgi:hypothetical protein